MKAEAPCYSILSMQHTLFLASSLFLAKHSLHLVILYCQCNTHSIRNINIRGMDVRNYRLKLDAG